ncbi:MAG: MFS transporter, partial [Gammaproteobacteria bacterium]|nr:MFS transporter [Gammaproteobacteria bacterium]
MTNTDPRRRMLPIVAMALFIDSMGIGIILPVAPKLVMELTGLPLAEAAPIGGWLTFAYAIMQFICSPILGNISDRFGRKPVLMASLAALSVDYVLMGLAPTITWLFVGRIIAGIAGATFATANAVVADVIPAEQRAKFFGMNGAAWGMGFIVGPVVGGLLGQYGSRVPFFAAAVFTALNFTIALFVLRETLSESNRRAFALRRANVFGALRSLRVIPGALLLLCTLFMYQIGHDTLPSSWAWVTMGKFGWGEREV